MPDPMEDHKCRKIAEARMGPGREEWIGILLEPIPGHEVETHCWHIITPYKSVVFGIVPEDMFVASVFAEIINKKPLNPKWVTRMAANYQKIGEIENA